MNRFRKTRRVGYVVIALVVLAVSYRVLGVYQFRSGECTAHQPRSFQSTYPKRLVVMTYNIEGHASLLSSEHIAKIAETIRRVQPDIVGINEAHRFTWQARFGDHVEQLRSLTRMNVVFGRSYTFMGGDFGNAVLTRGRILSSEVHDLPGTGEPRSLLETLIQIDGGTIHFYVAHVAAWASLGRAARGLQLKCINEHIGASGYPYVLAGDLNAPPHTPELKTFLDRNVLLFAGDPKMPTHKVMNQRLDYILCDKGWRVVSARVLDEGPSDHRPVVAELVHP
jgi:endonuclease/exonuclease/phosphatase family metal-dependent hydrolase